MPISKYVAGKQRVQVKVVGEGEVVVVATFRGKLLVLDHNSVSAGRVRGAAAGEG